MAAATQQLHQLLKEDQEPFHLTTYISHKRSQFNNPTKTTLHLNKQRKPEITLKPGNLCRHACFLSFANSPDVRKSPFPDFHSPAPMSPCKNGAVFLHIPSQITEAAMRIQKQQQGKSVGFGLFGSFLKRLKDRSNNRSSKKRGIGNSNVCSKQEENVRTITNVDKLVDSNRASTSVSCCSDHETNHCDCDLWETRFCVSPFRFSVHQSPLSSGRRTPDFSSPVASPSRVVKQSKEKSEIQESGNLQQEEEEDKEQCSPVSILDPPFEDDEHESAEAEEENSDHEMECSYANVQRAKEQLLYRLRRFEKLAELDPIELERKLLEGSDSDDQGESEDSNNDEPMLSYTNHNVEQTETKAYNQPRVQSHSPKRSTDPMPEEKNDVICLSNREVVLGRVCKRLDFSKEVKFATIDMMIGLDFNKDVDGWKTFSEQGEETVADIEFAIFGLLVDELSEELYPVDGPFLDVDYVHFGCT